MFLPVVGSPRRNGNKRGAISTLLIFHALRSHQSRRRRGGSVACSYARTHVAQEQTSDHAMQAGVIVSHHENTGADKICECGGCVEVGIRKVPAVRGM